MQRKCGHMLPRLQRTKQSDKRRGLGREYRNDHGAIPSGGSHVLGNIDVNRNTEMACLSHVSRRMLNWRTPGRERAGTVRVEGHVSQANFFRVLNMGTRSHN
jgi:hypothetical protein